jgi:DNA mismatch repair protein MutL
MTGKFPACVLNIEINPSEADVNVSPSKTEVRFAREKEVTSALYFAVKSALINSDYVKETAVSELRQSSQKTRGENFEPIISNYKQYDQLRNSENNPAENITEETAAREFKYISKESFADSSKTETKSLLPEQSESEKIFIVIGELFGTYIICSDEENLILVDKHAAHERINFNRLKSELVKSSQILAESVKVKLDAQHCNAMADNAGMLEDIGMDIAVNSDFAEVLAVPSILASREIPSIIEEIADVFVSGGKDADVIFDEILHGIACRSSIKAHDKTEIKDLENLAKLVNDSNDLRFCPHGRPITIKISKKEIEKSFGRIQ